MKLYRIENIKLKPLLVFAHSYDDAKNIFAHSLINGMRHRPDADFDIVDWDASQTICPDHVNECLNDEQRGFVWWVDDAGGVLTHTELEEP